MESASITYNTAKYPNFKEFLWYESQEENLLRQYMGRYIVIKNEQVIGDYGTRKLARQQTLKNHQAGTFIIHLCTDKDPRKSPRLNGRQLITIENAK
jgi:hypothetical protein